MFSKTRIACLLVWGAGRNTKNKREGKPESPWQGAQSFMNFYISCLDWCWGARAS